MEEAMSHTALSRCGTDSRVKLPNLTDEEVNWQRLEDLYSINESRFDCRPDSSPGPDDWANFQKDVDNMFALRHVFNTFNRTLELQRSGLPELGSGAGCGGPEEGSGDVWPGLAGPAPYESPPAPGRGGRPEQAVNDLPDAGTSTLMEPRSGPSGDRPLLQSGVRARQLEEIEGGGFSGNGPTELETRDGGLLRAAVGPTQRELDPEDEEDIFQAQGYLPVSPQTPRPRLQAATTRSPPTLTGPPPSVGAALKASPQPLPSDYEGSGTQPQAPNQTL